MPAIVYQFSQTGAGAVLDTFKSLEAKVAAAEKAQARTTRASRGSADPALAAQRRSNKETAYAQQQLAKYKQDQAKRLEKQQLAGQKQLQREVARGAEKNAADAKRKHAEQAKIIENADKKRAREQQKHNEETARKHRQAQERTMAQARAAQERHRGQAASLARGAGHWAMGTVAAGGVAAAGLGAMALRKTFNLEELASKVSTQSRQKGQQAVDPRTLRREWENAAIGAPGATAEGVGAAVQTIVSRTGELGVARAWEAEIATIIAATDVDGAALGDSLSTMFQKFDVKSVDDMKAAMAGMIMQGKQGAFELSDAAQYMGEVGAAAERFGGSMRGPEGLKTLGGMMQIARQSTGSGAEAATAVETMFRQLVSDSANIKTKTGVSVFKDKNKTQTDDFKTLIPKIIAGAKGNQATLQGIFDVRGIRAVSPLISEYNKIVDEARKNGANEKAAAAKGMEGVSAMMTKAMETGASWDDVMQDAADRGKSSANTLSSSWELVSSVIGGKMEPVLAGFVAQLAGWLSRDDVQIALGNLAEALAVGGEALGSAFGWIIEKLIAIGAIDPQELAVKKAKRLGGKATAENEQLAPSTRAQLDQIQKDAEEFAPDQPIEVLGQLAQESGIDSKTAAKYYQNKQIMEAAKGVLFSGRADAISDAPTGLGAGHGMGIGAAFGLPGMILGGIMGEKAETKMRTTPAQAKAQAEQQADVTAAAAKLDALTAAATSATKALNGLEAKPTIWPF